MLESKKSVITIIMLFVIGLALGAMVAVVYKPQLTRVNHVEKTQKICKCEIITKIQKRD